MFCPFCKTEYRAGILRCSDCSMALVDAVPADSSDPNFMVMLWNDESLRFLEAVCSELDRASIAVATPRVEVLLRDPLDRYHLKSLKTFPYVLGVFKSAFPAARIILESVAEKFLPPIQPPPAAAYPEPFDERVPVAHRAKSEATLQATTAIFCSDDSRAVEFLEASLKGVEIPFREVPLENGGSEIQVPPPHEAAARQVVEEIARGTSAHSVAASREVALLHDRPPTSYFLAWFLPIAYWFFFSMIVFLRDGANTEAFAAMFASLLTMMEAICVFGSFWLVYQAVRYEVKPFRYCLMALLPLTCIWYYVERYSVRRGAERLPIAARMRMQMPRSS